MAEPATQSGQSHDEVEETSSQMRDDGSHHSAESQYADAPSDDDDDDATARHSISGDPAAGRGERTLRRPLEHTLMYQAALRGDWQAAEIILRRDPNVVRAKLTKKGNTALHVAASIKRTNFVRQLVLNYLNQSDLGLKNNFGYTAFCYAAASGVVEIASVMREQYPDVVNIRPHDKKAPIYIAALLGKTEMVSYLYRHARDEDLEETQWLDLLIATIRQDMFDVALRILRRNPTLATLMDSNGGTALNQLVQKDISKINASYEAILRCFVVPMFAAVPWLSWLTRTFEKPLNQKKALLLAERLWAVMQPLEREELYKLLGIGGDSILHDAAEAGNVDFITMLTRDDPDLILEKNNNGHTIFHTAVLHRQAKVYSLIQQLGSLKDLTAMIVDRDGNNILHLAAKSASRNRLKIVSGVALQMQRELLWYKEVEKVVPTSFLEKMNHKKKKPRQLFSYEHTNLLRVGEIWMKDTSNYCMIVAALIATVAFAAAITVPGGNKEGTGMPLLSRRSWFTVFVISDAVAMFFSTASIIMFLSILTSRYQEDDFLVWLPVKLMLGLTSLFVSIAAMVLAFTTTFFLLFNEDNTQSLKWVAVPACGLLVALFATLHVRLWFDTIRSVCSSIFLFHSGKHSLY